MSSPSARRDYPWVVPTIIVVVFLGLGVARLGRPCLLEPDSADYVLMARTLAATGEYRAPYEPTGVPYAWRPPGLPLLLGPAALARPYDVVAAKATVLAWGVALLGAVYLLARRSGPAGYALGALALVATSPYTLLWGTEVLSEVPFVAIVLAIVVLVGRRDSSPPRWAAAAALLALLPLLRTVGLAMWLACAAWLMMSRRRGRFALSFLLLAALIPYGAWSLRNSRSGQESYLAFVWNQLSASDLGESLYQAAGSTLLNYNILVGLWVPGGAPGRPAYDLATSFPAQLPVEAWPIAASVASAMLAACGLGLWTRRREGGALVALFLAPYLAFLALWPSHHERFLWPLVPILLAFLPAGLGRAIEHGKGRSPAAGGWAHRIALATGTALVAWQLVISGGMAWTNLADRRDPDRAYERGAPSYFADWHAAGEWMRENTRPYDRVITGHTDLACTSRRFERWVMGDGGDWPVKVVNFTARYLALPSDYHGAMLPGWFFTGDSTYSIRKVYDRRGVAVFEVAPNRTGVVPSASRRHEADLAACEVFRERAPWRVDLKFIHAMLLDATGRPDEAYRELQRLVGQGRADLPTLFNLAYLGLQLGHPAEALRFVAEAFVQPESEAMAGGLRQMQAQARADLAGEPSLAERVGRARWLATLNRADEAESTLDLLVRSNPGDALCHFARGEIRQRRGRAAEAGVDYARASELGHPEAGAKLRLLAIAEALDGSGRARPADGPGAVRVDPLDPRSYVEFAAMLRRDETPGRALAVLEGAVERFGDLPALLIPLAEVHLFYGYPEEAGSLYRRTLHADPRNVEARAGLERVGYLLTEPRFR